MMTENILKAKELLNSKAFSCVLFDGTDIRTSKKHGVLPLIEFFESKHNFSRYCAADKVIGAGAAHLYVLLDVKEVWANVISDSAMQILVKNDIEVFFETKAPNIINRQGDGLCPIEKCVKNITDSNQALGVIKAKLKELSNK